MERYITLRAFAEQTQLSIHTVRAWRRQGLPVVKLHGSLRVDLEAAQTWMIERKKVQFVKGEGNDGRR